MPPTRAFVVTIAPIALLAGCAQAPSPVQPDMQERLAAAEARASAAEARASAAEAHAAQHQPDAAPPPGPPVPGVPELGQSDPEFGQPMNDTAPIEPVPAMPAEAPQQ